MFFGNRKKRRPIRHSGVPAKSSGGRIFGKIIYWFSLVFFAGATFYILLLSPFLAVSKIKVSGTEDLSPEVITEKVSAELAGKYFNLLEKNNFILISKKSVADHIERNFIKIESVEISKKFPDELDISVKEKKIKLVLCAGKACYVIDDKGVAYAEADFETNRLGEDGLVVIRDDSGKTIIKSDKVLEAGYVDFILGFRDKIRSQLAIDLEKEIRVPSIASGELRAKTTEGWQIYLNKDIPSEKEVEMLKIVLNNKTSGDRRKDLDYVDIRIDNKVYYKFK